VTFGTPQDHKNQKPRTCVFCGFKSFDEESRGAHSCVSRADRRAQNLRFRCDFCGLAYSKRAVCLLHCAKHDHPTLVKCPVVGCNRRYRVPEHLEKHKLRAHGPGVKPKKRDKVQCQVCGDFLACNRSLKVILPDLFERASHL
jgi:hypothetical protein